MIKLENKQTKTQNRLSEERCLNPLSPEWHFQKLSKSNSITFSSAQKQMPWKRMVFFFSCHYIWRIITES